MQTRILVAAVLLGGVAIAQETPAESEPLLQPFARKPWKFDFAKPPVIVNQTPGVVRPPSRPAESEVCSIPLTNVGPRTPAAKMPVMPVNPNAKYAMKFLNPPAPSCDDQGARKQPGPDNRP